MAFGTGTLGARDQAAFFAMLGWILSNPEVYRADNIEQWKAQVAKAAYAMADALSSAS